MSPMKWKIVDKEMRTMYQKKKNNKSNKHKINEWTNEPKYNNKRMIGKSARSRNEKRAGITFVEWCDVIIL